MTGHYPTLAEAIEYLRQSGKEAMALVVEGIADSERRCRRAAEENLRAYYEVKNKYEPIRRWPSNHRAPPESDG